MATMLPTKLVLLLCFVGSVLAQFESICNYDCVATDVYGPYCGGAVCVYGETDPSQHEKLCSQECADAILGKPMRDCVLSVNPHIRNLGAETRNMVIFIRVFCDNVGVDHDIPHIEHPAPAIAPEYPPIDSPELEVITDDDLVPAPVEAVPSLSVAVVPSEPVEAPQDMDLDDGLDMDSPVPMPSPPAMAPPAAVPSPVAPISPVSAEKDLDDYTDKDSMDEFDLI